MFQRALLGAYLFSLACGGPIEPVSEELGALDRAELAAVEQPLTSQTTSNNPSRISGFTSGCSPAGAACTSNMPAGCTCLVPPDKTVTFDLATEVTPLRERVQQIVNILNGKYAAAGWSFSLLPFGQIGEVTISNARVADVGPNDVRSYTNMLCLAGGTLSEPTQLSGSFRTLGRCGLSVDLLKIIALGASLGGGPIADRVIRHALMHNMIKAAGLGLTGNSGDAATGINISVNAEKTGTVTGQDCLVNNYSTSNAAQILLSNSARCPAFPAGM